MADCPSLPSIPSCPPCPEGEDPTIPTEPPIPSDSDPSPDIICTTYTHIRAVTTTVDDHVEAIVCVAGYSVAPHVTCAYTPICAYDQYVYTYTACVNACADSCLPWVVELCTNYCGDATITDPLVCQAWVGQCASVTITDPVVSVIDVTPRAGTSLVVGADSEATVRFGGSVTVTDPIVGSAVIERCVQPTCYVLVATEVTLQSAIFTTTTDPVIGTVIVSQKATTSDSALFTSVAFSQMIGSCTEVEMTQDLFRLSVYTAIQESVVGEAFAKLTVTTDTAITGAVSANAWISTKINEEVIEIGQAYIRSCASDNTEYGLLTPGGAPVVPSAPAASIIETDTAAHCHDIKPATSIIKTNTAACCRAVGYTGGVLKSSGQVTATPVTGSVYWFEVLAEVEASRQSCVIVSLPNRCCECCTPVDLVATLFDTVANTTTVAYLGFDNVAEQWNGFDQTNTVMMRCLNGVIEAKLNDTLMDWTGDIATYKYFNMLGSCCPFQMMFGLNDIVLSVNQCGVGGRVF